MTHKTRKLTVLRRRWVVLVATTVVFCFSGSSADAGLFSFLKAKEPEWAILPMPNPRPAWMESSEGSWLPSIYNAKQAMAGVRDYLKQRYERGKAGYQQDELSYILGNWSSYACQVIGVTSYQGKKVIVLNFFPKRDINDWAADWKTNEVAVKGGGAGYFRVEYDPEQKAFGVMWANAPA